MNFEDVIRKRCATRKFSNQKIEKEKLMNILEAGRIAPTAKNLQPFKIYVIESEEGLKKIDKSTPCRYNAPVVLLICGNKDIAYHNESFSSYEMDASIVTTHMMLEATNLGIDNIWVEAFNKETIINEFNISLPLIPICLLPLGYKSEDCPMSPNHNIRKPIEELVEFK